MAESGFACGSGTVLIPDVIRIEMRKAQMQEIEVQEIETLGIEMPGAMWIPENLCIERIFRFFVHSGHHGLG